MVLRKIITKEVTQWIIATTKMRGNIVDTTEVIMNKEDDQERNILMKDVIVVAHLIVIEDLINKI